MATGTKVADVWINIQGDLTQYNNSLKQAQSDSEKLNQTLGQQLSQAFRNPQAYIAGGGTSPLAGLVASIRDDQSLGQSLGQSIQNAIRNGAFAGVGTEMLTEFTGFTRSIGTNFAHDVATVGGSALNGLLNIGRSVFGELKNLAGDVFKGFTLGLGIGSFLALEQVVSRLVGLIPDLINKGQQYAATVQQITLATGASAQEASKWLGIYQLLGGTATDFATKVNRVAVSITTNSKVLKEYGITTVDANGAQLNQIQILEQVRALFETIPDGIGKTDLAVKLFGRNAGNSLGAMLNLLSLTPQQFQEAAGAAQAAGLIVDDEAVKLGREFTIAQNNIGNAFTGLGVTIFQTVGPEIISFLDGLAADLEAHAKEIAAFFTNVVNYVLGLIQGLTGISLPLNTLSTQLDVTQQSGNDFTTSIAATQAEIDKETKSLASMKAPLGDTTSGFRDQTRALQDETTAIDAQIKHWQDLATAADKALTTQLDGLTKVVDAQLQQLSIQDQIAARAKTAADLAKQGEQAQDALAKATLGVQQAQLDVANTQAKIQETAQNDAQAIADAQQGGDPKAIFDAQQKASDDAKQAVIDLANAQQNYLNAIQAVKDAQQGIADNQQAIADNAAKNAEDDRKAQLDGIKTYIQGIAQIAASEDKAAALRTLHAREAALQAEIDKDKQLGNQQAVADDELRLEAVVKAAHDVAVGEKAGTQITELQAKKNLLAEEIKAVQDAQAAETASVKSAALDQFNAKKQALEDQLAANKAHLAQLEADQKQYADNEHARAVAAKHDQEVNAEFLTSTYGSGGAVPKAFTAAQQAGQDAANGIKSAFGDLIDFLLGSESHGSALPGDVGGTAAHGATSTRSGGLLGALQEIGGALTDMVNGLAGIATALPGKDVLDKLLLIGAAYATVTGNAPVAIALLAAAGIDVALNAGVTADPTGNAGPGKGSRVPLSGVPGHAAGGWAGENGPELSWLGETGREFVLSPDMLEALGGSPAPLFGSAAGPSGDIHIHVSVPWSSDSVDFIAQQLAWRRR